MNKIPIEREKIGCWNAGCWGSGVGGCGGCLLPIVIFFALFITDPNGDPGGPLALPISGMIGGFFGAIIGALFFLIVSTILNRSRRAKSDAKIPPIDKP